MSDAGWEKSVSPQRYLYKHFLLVLGLGPKTWTRALAKSSDQNSSQYRALQPHWRDHKADDLIQNCVAAYARHTYDVPRHWESSVHQKMAYYAFARRLKKKHFISGNLVQIWTFWPSLGYTCIGSMCCYQNELVISERSIRALRLEAPETKSSSVRLLVPPLLSTDCRFSLQ